MSDLTTAVIRFLVPLRPVLIGLLGLIALMVGCMVAGMYVTFVLNHPGDRTVLFLLAGMVYPGPYFFYGVFGVFLFHARRSLALSVTYNVGIAILIALAVGINLREVDRDTLAARLHETLFENFAAAAVTTVLFIGLLLLQARRTEPRRHYPDNVD